MARATRWRQTLSHAGRLLLRTVISCPAGGLPRPAPFNAAASGCKGAAGQAEGQSQVCHVPTREHLQETQGGLLLPHLLPLPGRFQKAHLPQKGGLGGKTSNSPPPDWLPPGFCVACCHTVSLLRTLDHERHGSAGSCPCGAKTQETCVWYEVRGAARPWATHPSQRGRPKAR